MSSNLGKYTSKSGKVYYYSVIETFDGRVQLKFVDPHNENVDDHELRESAEATIESMERADG